MRAKLPAFTHAHELLGERFTATLRHGPGGFRGTTVHHRTGRRLEVGAASWRGTVAALGEAAWDAVCGNVRC